jgi:acetyl-CoA carboxylase biotin carboxyl carrier protein
VSWDPDKLRSLFDLLIEKDITEFEHEDEGARVRIVRGKVAVATFSHTEAAPSAATVDAEHRGQQARGGADHRGASRGADDDVEVTSPFVGTFYRSPTPDSPSFVEVGSLVRPGQALCIIEAMKLMNEIESDISGTITEVCVPNGKAVEFGQKLFRIKKA